MCQTKTIATCPKCMGKKHIRGFEHYAAGVCFECGGSGSVVVKLRAVADRVASPENIAKAEFILSANAATIARMTYGQLDRAHDFAVSEFSCVFYPGLADVYHAKFWAAFEVAQDAAYEAHMRREM